MKQIIIDDSNPIGLKDTINQYGDDVICVVPLEYSTSCYRNGMLILTKVLILVKD